MDSVPTIIQIKTNNGDITVLGHKYGEHLVLHQNPAGLWMISHALTGFLVACLKEKSHATAMATVLSNLNVSWQFDSPREIPERTKQVVHEVFSSFMGILSYADPKKK